MNVKSIWFTLLFFLAIHCNSQSKLYTQDQIAKVSNWRAVYKGTKNETIGAGNALEGLGIKIVFDSIFFDPGTKVWNIKGTTYHAADNIDDGLRLDGVDIFIAKPKGDRLKKIKPLGMSDSTSTDKRGDFHLKFELTKKRNLYFGGSDGFYLIEIKLGELKND